MQVKMHTCVRISGKKTKIRMHTAIQLLSRDLQLLILCLLGDDANPAFMQPLVRLASLPSEL